MVAYLAENQRAALANVRDLSVYSPSRYLVLDASARRHLELFVSTREGSEAWQPNRSVRLDAHGYGIDGC